MIGIRVDGNSHIASGHIMRCISIASALREQKQECIFIVSDDEAVELIKKNGFSVIILEGRWDKLEVELEELLRVVSQYKIGKILIDSYYVTNNYLARLKQESKVIFIDDLEKEIYEADLIINYSFFCDQVAYGEKYKYKDTQLLIGAKYAPLRNEFLLQRSKLNKVINDILITAGGSDPYNIIIKLINEIRVDYKLKDCNLHVVTGKFYSYIEELEALQRENKNIIIYKNISNMAEIMSKTDIAISAGGTTLLELCCLQVPTVSFAFVDNQLNSVNYYATQGIIATGGDIRQQEEQAINKIITEVRSLYEDYKQRALIRERMSLVTDGKGTQRIAEQIIALN